MNEHEVTQIDGREPGRRRHIGFIDWLNRKLLPVMGPPPMGPYETVVKQIGEAVCPVCGQPMSGHTIDRSTLETILNCPREPRPQRRDDEPVNELGMDKTSPRSDSAR